MDIKITDENLEELTLLLLYLTSWKEKAYADVLGTRSWKGYNFDVLNRLEEKEYIYGSKKAKSVWFTEEGIGKAEVILKKYKEFLSS